MCGGAGGRAGDRGGRGRRAAPKAAGAAGPARLEDVEVKLSHVAFAVMVPWAGDAMCPPGFDSQRQSEYRGVPFPGMYRECRFPC